MDITITIPDEHTDIVQRAIGEQSIEGFLLDQLMDVVERYERQKALEHSRDVRDEIGKDLDEGNPNARWPEWVQPTGAHDAWPPGTIVLFQGRAFRNKLEVVNVWHPEEYGWERLFSEE